MQPDTSPAYLGQSRLPIARKVPKIEIVAGTVLALWLIGAAYSVTTNPRFEWGIFGEYFFSKPILDGLVLTLQLTAVSMVIGIVLGTLLALMRLSKSRVMVAVSWTYAWVFRAIPLLVQLIIWYNLGALYPKIVLGVPFGPEFFSVDASTVITAWTAAILGLGLHEAAYMAEIIRGGIQSIDRGQGEAAAALGMKGSQRMTRIILPQAMRLIIPPTGNQLIGMLKMTSLVSVMALSDLLFSAQAIYSRTFQPVPLLMVAAVWYLFLTSVLMVVQSRIERRLARGTRPMAAQGAKNPAEISSGGQEL